MTTHPVLWDPDREGISSPDGSPQNRRSKQVQKLKDIVGYQAWFDKIADAWRKAEKEQES